MEIWYDRLGRTRLYADFALLAAGSLLALSDLTRAADDAPSSDNP